MKVILVRLSFVIIILSLFIYCLIKPPAESLMNNTEKRLESDKNCIQEEKEKLRIKVKFSKTDNCAIQTEIISSFSEPDSFEIEELESAAQEESLQIINIDETLNKNITAPEINLRKIFSKIVYPSSMKRQNIQRNFDLVIYIDTFGNMELVFPAYVEKEFESAVRKAFANQTARPALLDEKPVSVCFTVPVEFSIR